MTTLHFIGPNGALPRFPYRHELRQLASLRSPSHLDAFVRQAWLATDRLWLLDLHFVEHGYSGLLHALARALVCDVRILSERVDDKPSRLVGIRDAVEHAWNQGRPMTKLQQAPTTIHWADRLVRKAYPYAHDRFVILDDSLWHFGFAACGSSNCLSAASGPWSAVDTEAVTFFEDLWEDMNRE